MSYRPDPIKVYRRHLRHLYWQRASSMILAVFQLVLAWSFVLEGQPGWVIFSLTFLALDLWVIYGTLVDADKLKQAQRQYEVALKLRREHVIKELRK